MKGASLFRVFTDVINATLYIHLKPELQSKSDLGLRHRIWNHFYLFIIE